MLCLLDNTKTCRPVCQLEMICALVRWILRYLPLIRKPWHLPLYRCFLRCRSVANTSPRLSSIRNPVSASSGRESDVQIDESSLTPGSIQISPRELTRSQGGLARSSGNCRYCNRRIVGKRTIISPAPFALPDNVDSASVPESLDEAGLPQVF